MAWPSKDTVAREMGINEAQVRRSVEELVALGQMAPAGKRAKNVQVYSMRIQSARILSGREHPDSSIRTQESGLTGQSGRSSPPVRTPEPKCPDAGDPQSYQDPTRTDHTPRGSVDPAPAAPAEKAQDRATPSRSEAAPPPAGERPGRHGFRTYAPPTEEEDNRDYALRLIEAGLFSEVAASHRMVPALALVYAYRKAQPASSPLDWLAAVDMPTLTGPVLDRGAWLYAHLNGYARDGWLPENRDQSPRKFHAALLAGKLDEALAAAKIENSYAPEREAAKHREPTTKPRRGGTTIHQIGDVVDPDCRRAEGA